MGVHAVLISQDTVDHLEQIFAAADIVVEPIELSDEDHASGGVGRFLIMSSTGARIMLELVRDERLASSEIVCTIHLDSGVLPLGVHNDLYKRVVRRLRQFETRKRS